MDPQALINALTEQRNAALNQAALAQAAVAILQAENTALKAELADKTSEEKDPEVKD